ncbi:MAG TPA: hypothetical protein VHA35_17780, partial [Dongiaceae bacterium]|nr:hypothetical protein [Dongiaceae bacterium]
MTKPISASGDVMRARRWALTGAAAFSAFMVVTALHGGSAYAGPRSEPFDAWAEPVIQSKMTVEEAKALVAERTKPQTEWKGPT